MKKSAFFASLIIGIFAFFVLSNGFAAGPAKPKTPPVVRTVPSTQTAPGPSLGPIQTKTTVKGLRNATITNVKVGADASGNPTWTATVKNIGTADLNCRDLELIGTKVNFNGPFPASGMLLGNGKLSPGQSLSRTIRWNRCCKDRILYVDLKDRVSNKFWVHNSQVGKGNNVLLKDMKVSIRRIDWDDASKSWKATIINNEDYSVKVSVKGKLGNFSAGTQQIVVGAHAEAKTMQFPVANAQNGDALSVYRFFVMAGTCSETQDDCAGVNSHRAIIIPESKSFE